METALDFKGLCVDGQVPSIKYCTSCFGKRAQAEKFALPTEIEVKWPEIEPRIQHFGIE
jgi:hypothetical protein